MRCGFRSAGCECAPRCLCQPVILRPLTSSGDKSSRYLLPRDRTRPRSLSPCCASMVSPHMGRRVGVLYEATLRALLSPKVPQFLPMLMRGRLSFYRANGFPNRCVRPERRPIHPLSVAVILLFRARYTRGLGGICVLLSMRSLSMYRGGMRRSACSPPCRLQCLGPDCVRGLRPRSSTGIPSGWGSPPPSREWGRLRPYLPAVTNSYLRARRPCYCYTCSLSDRGGPVPWVRAHRGNSICCTCWSVCVRDCPTV